ncbi:hepatitis A virus cellular receptor 1 homolog isoform X3 [Archocentrus centrarchus]|uniref:hepatitis A virus cellular receptor 1 homolog isoform X3 n=1 Tax=Archocentrus centrarchus TaxID=63155 RepID=UPI0011E9F874|nr:hepatitis A virus cellular receptor 1 homolog isoform X3 [Archocentrus centrarchus]
MKLVLLLALLTASECDSTEVKGQAGQTTSLPCKYDRKYYGALSVCWGRGEIPLFRCGDQLISTDGDRVETRASSRYELLGRLEDGDVSLTILHLTEGDAGRYGCRVAIPGWFNDEKHHVDLTVVTAPQIHTSTAQPTAAAQTEGHMTSTKSLLTSFCSVTSSREKQEGGLLTDSLFYVLQGLIFLLIVSGLLIIRGLKLLCKTPQRLQQIGSLIKFSSTSSTLQLHTGQSAEDNIYHISGKEVTYKNYP